MMDEGIWSVFEPYKEGVLIVKGGKTVYMNEAAKKLLPEKIQEEGLCALLPGEMIDYDGSSYSSAVETDGRRLVFTAVKTGGYRIFTFFPPDEDGDEKLENFLASVSVQLRSAMSSLYMVSDLAKPELEASGNERLLRYIAMMDHNVHMAGKVVDNIDFLRGMLSKSCGKNVSVFDIAALCRDTAHTVTALSAGRCAPVRFECTDSSIDFAGDRAKIEKLLLSLLSNSMKHTGKDGKIAVMLKKTSSGVILTVSDTGAGIPPDRLASAFEGIGSDPAKASGLGAGLSVAEFIARMHGGALLIESEPDKGTKATAMLRSDGSHVFKEEMEEYGSNRIEPLLTELSDVLGYEAYMPKYTE